MFIILSSSLQDKNLASSPVQINYSLLQYLYEIYLYYPLSSLPEMTVKLFLEEQLLIPRKYVIS